MRIYRKKFFKIFFISIACFAVGGFLLNRIAATGIFEPKIIDYKYCYVFYPASNRIEAAMIANDKDRAKEILNFYNSDMATLFNMIETFHVPTDIKVGIIKYSADSLLAKVNVKYETKYRPFHMDETGWVPVICLHDTIPPDYHDKGDEEVWSEYHSIDSIPLAIMKELKSHITDNPIIANPNEEFEVGDAILLKTGKKRLPTRQLRYLGRNNNIWQLTYKHGGHRDALSFYPIAF